MLAMIASMLVASAPPPIVAVPSAPPPISTQSSGPANMALWMPGTVTCAGGVDPAPIALRRPYSTLVWRQGTATKPITLSFAIDGTGRPMSIQRTGWQPIAREDRSAPALAASRFAPGPARAGCTITYTPDIQPLDVVPLAEIASYVVTRQLPTLPRAAFDRLRAGDECRTGRDTQPLVTAHPEYAAIPATPGVRDWTMVGFGLDSEGRPVDVTTVTGTGNEALDAAAVKAVAASRFNRGADRKGCTVPFWRHPAVLPSHEMPPKEEPKAGPCSDSEWARAPRLVYPPAYNARAIEGWATVSYDVAPWGEIGNVKVIEAQPSEDFGTAASSMLMSASKKPGPGAQGCTTRVVYRMEARRAEADGG